MSRARARAVRLRADTIREAAGVLKCIGHPARLAILEVLERGERNVGDVQREVGLDQPAVSHHLGLLHDRGILARRRDGVNVLYRVRDEKVLRVLDCIRDCQR